MNVKAEADGAKIGGEILEANEPKSIVIDSERKIMSRTMDDSIVSHFKLGAIVRVKLTNFMTYSNVSLDAGPYLNLIIGPNGTGKSAIVCGLIIGLAGDISNTGRSGNLTEYIKFGCNSANIEIELHNPTGENHIINRKMVLVENEDANTTCQTTWFLDDRRVLKREIKELVTSLNISVDNLCQCLPQERVVEFVKMNSKELLIKTQEAIGQADLINRHKLLCDLSREIKELTQKFKSLAGITEEEQQIQKRCEEEVKRLKERKQIRKQLNLMEAKRSWLEFEQCKREFEESKKLITEKEKILKELEASYEPVIKAKRQFEKELEKIQASLGSCNREKQIIIKDLKTASDEIKKLHNQETNLVVEYTNAVEEDKKRHQAMKDLAREIAALQNELKTHESIDSLEATLAEVSGQLKLVSDDFRKVDQEIDRTEQQRDHVHRKLREEQMRLENNSAIGRRKGLLNIKNEHAFRALQLLEENRGRFRKEIHPPIMLSIDVKDKSYVKFVEACFSYRDLFAFVCEDKEDLKTFGALARTQGLKIAIVMMPDEPIRMNQGLSRQLSSFGFTHTIADMFDAPPAIKQFLEQQYSISQIPVQVDEFERESPIESKINEINRLHVSRFFTFNTSFRVSTSRYDKETIITRDTIPNPSFLHILNEGDDSTQTNIRSLKIQFENYVASLNEMNESKNNIDVQKKELIRKENLIKNKIEDFKSLQTRIDIKKRDLTAKKNSKFNAEAAKQELVEKITHQRSKFEKLTIKLANFSKKLSKNVEKISTTLIDKKVASMRVENLDSLVARARQDASRHKNEIRHLTHSLEDKKAEAARLRHKAATVSKAKGVALDAHNQLTRESKSQFSNFPDDLDSLNASIGALAMKEQSLSGLFNDQAEEDAERRQQTINNNRRMLEQWASQLSEKKDTLALNKEEWLRPLNELIERISSNFEEFMRHMGYAGQVQLSEQGENFEEYGISIKVKYRAADEISDLSAFHQSGGERSVATVIYMLALQELSRVPFRCVDEINQGMDATNERKVFDLVVRTAFDNSSQYFLLSPKLLLDLEYNDKMHIHCIHNGPKLEADWVASL